MHESLQTIDTLYCINCTCNIHNYIFRKDEICKRFVSQIWYSYVASLKCQDQYDMYIISKVFKLFVLLVRGLYRWASGIVSAI